MTAQKTSGGLDFETLKRAIEQSDADSSLTSTPKTPRCSLSTATPPQVLLRCCAARRRLPSISQTSAVGT